VCQSLSLVAGKRLGHFAASAPLEFIDPLW
jgi:hypothetical protein